MLSLLCLSSGNSAKCTSCQQEARSNTITLTEFSPDIVDSVIRYIYTGVVGFAPGTMEDSPLSAFVKLWVAADFFVFNQLMNEATTLIETYFDEKLAKIALSYTNLDVNSPNYIDSFLDQLFKGVASAFSKSPHSRPCQKLIVDFIHAGRFFFYANGKFRNLLACASQHFAHKVFLATVQGNISRWTGPEGCYSEYDSIVPFGRTCSHCCKEGGLISNQWICDPFVLSARPENFSLFIKTRWRCREWVREHGFKGRGS